MVNLVLPVLSIMTTAIKCTGWVKKVGPQTTFNNFLCHLELDRALHTQQSSTSADSVFKRISLLNKKSSGICAVHAVFPKKSK